MIRNALLAVGAVVVIVAGFLITFAVWRNTDQARAVALGIPYTEFNFKTAHAQERGCNACHGDHLAEDVSRMIIARKSPIRHGIFVTSYGIAMRVEDCLICHNTKSGLAFAGSIHSKHLHAAGFINMGGTCDSCHGTLLNGKFVLYSDETRYQILNGVKYNRTPAFTQSSSALRRDREQAAKAD